MNYKIIGKYIKDLKFNRVLFDNGVNGSKVDHYKVYGGEHFWFMEDDINSSELIWEFFSQHDLNGYIN